MISVRAVINREEKTMAYGMGSQECSGSMSKLLGSLSETRWGWKVGWVEGLIELATVGLRNDDSERL